MSDQSGQNSQTVSSGASAPADAAASAAAQVATAPKGPIINISEKAAVQIKQLQERENRSGHNLRVSVVGGGCSGLSYKLAFDSEVKEKDTIIELHGVRLLVDGKSALFLRGTTLDFTDGLNGQGFVFANPNAKGTCGCGTSFSA